MYIEERTSWAATQDPDVVENPRTTLPQMEDEEDDWEDDDDDDDDD